MSDVSKLTLRVAQLEREIAELHAQVELEQHEHLRSRVYWMTQEGQRRDEVARLREALSFVVIRLDGKPNRTRGEWEADRVLARDKARTTLGSPSLGTPLPPAEQVKGPGLTTDTAKDLKALYTIARGLELRPALDREHPTIVDLRGRLRRFEAKHAIVNGVWGDAAPSPSPAGSINLYDPNDPPAVRIEGHLVLAPPPSPAGASEPLPGLVVPAELSPEQIANLKRAVDKVKADATAPRTQQKPLGDPSSLVGAVSERVHDNPGAPLAVTPLPKPAPARRWAVQYVGNDGQKHTRGFFTDRMDASDLAIRVGGTVVEVDENGKEVKA